jgi:hypothetical protein
MSNVGKGVPSIKKLAQLRDGHQEDGRNRDEGVEPAVHLSIVTLISDDSSRGELLPGYDRF